MKKIELNILLIIIMEAGFLLLFFKENFINIIVGFLLGIILIFLSRNIPKNKFTHKILTITSCLFYFLFLYKIVLFVNDNILKNYSSLLIILSLIIISIYIAKKGYHTFIKTTEIIFYIIIILKTISLILTIPLINFNNLSINFHCNYRLIYIALFILFTHKCFYYLNNYQIKKKDLIISFINPLFIKILTLLTIGSTLSDLYQYPYVSYLKKIKYFDFIERMEGILSFEYLFCFIISLSFFLIFQSVSCTRKSL